ncbi:MAG: D-alanyl-D-alanine carboxypeptidase, partial [Clostridia bacterium]|nr:D-alanyl-D-alanine carboxypeptidase [Clostridia bacterium]
MKKIITILLIAVMLIPAFSLAGLAKEAPKPEYSANCVVYNIENNETCFALNETERLATAGSTKIMTAILALEHYEGHYDSAITVGDGWLKDVTGLTASFKAGETLVAEKVISALIIGNGNDAAYILAHAVAGSKEAFVDMMNQKAEELGMADTHYTNPAGTDEEGMYTTPS